MLDNKFTILEIIGQGGSSNVFRARDDQGNEWAIKAIRKDKNYYNKLGAHMISKEHNTLNILEGHPNLIRSFGVNYSGKLQCADNTEGWMYQVIELAKNGALSNIIRKTGPLEEELARFFMCQILHAVNHMHSSQFVHLDLKLENIFLDEFFNIKLGDLGSSANVSEENGFINQRRGTPLYMAPEVKLLEQGEEYEAYSADVYSLGILLFVMLTGEFPTPNDLGHTYESRETDESEDCNSPPKFDSMKLGHLSSNVTELIKEMTDENDITRPSIPEIFKHEWLWRPFDENISELVYQEMEARKIHIIEQSQTKSAELSLY